MITPRLIVAILALPAACAVQADELVNRADANGDGFVSLYELRAAYYADIEFNRRIEQSFAAYDTDGDGLISEAERRAAQGLAANETAPEPDPQPEQQAIPPTRGSGEAAFAAAAAPKTLPATVEEVAARQTATTAATASAAANAGGGLPETAPSVAQPPATTRRLSRSESWILQIDADNSGGASYNELLAGNDGEQFFSSSTFISADNDGDGELDADELEVLIQSVERQRRYQQRGR